MVVNFNEIKFDDFFNQVIDLLKKKNIQQAKNMFDEYIHYLADKKNLLIEEATDIAQRNFGYFAGYYNDDVRKLVLKHLNAAHPYLNINCTAHEAFMAGLKQGQLFKK